MIPFADGGLEARHWKVLENLVCLASTPSSNDLARELIELYFTEDQELRPCALAAEEQPAARGRSRPWHAPAGRGIYFTFVLPAGDRPLSLVPIAVARWTREAVREASGVLAELKWPNDLYVGRRKLAGILPEARTQGDETFLAVGIGMNVTGRAETLAVDHATTLEEEAGHRVSRASVLQAVLDRIDRELLAPDWVREIAGWEEASLHKQGDRMTIRREGEQLTGRYLGLDPSGFLRLETDGGEAVVAAGEVAEW